MHNLPHYQHPLTSALFYTNSFLKYLFIFIVAYIFVVALQYCASSCCTAKWTSHMYTHIPSIFDFPPIQVTTEHRVEFPVLYSRFSLVIYFIHTRVYISIPISQFIPPLPFPRWCPHIYSLHLCLYFCFANRFICTIFLDSTYMY